MIRSRMLRQFLVWYLLLIALPSILLATYAYKNVNTYAGNEMQHALSFDLERAAAAGDRVLEAAERSMLSIIASKEIRRVVSDMHSDVKNDHIAHARYAGEYELRPLVETLLFQEAAVKDVLFFIDGRCLFSYTHYVPADTPLLNQDSPWLGGVRNPFGIDGEYVLHQGMMRDYTHSPETALCSVVIMVSQEDLVHILSENVRYDDNLSALLGPDGVLVYSDPSGQSVALLDQGVAQKDKIGHQMSLVFPWDGHAVTMNAYRTPSSIEGLSYFQLSPTGHISAYTTPVLALVLRWAGVALLALALFAMLVSRQIIRPTVRLAGAMKDMTASSLDRHLAFPGVHNELEDVYDGYNSMLTRLKNSFARIRTSEKEKRHYQLAMLKYQINPHFLHNTINSIRFSCLKNGDEKSADMLVTLGRLLRNTLNNPTEMISLSVEMNNLRDYVALQQTRYNHHIHFEITDMDGLDNLVVPMMILQPIVENAVMHGLSTALNSGRDARIILSARVDEKELLMMVRDNGQGIDRSALQSILSTNKKDMVKNHHIGLANIHHRIQLMLGEAYGVSIDSEVDAFTCVTLRLPVIRNEKKDKH